MRGSVSAAVIYIRGIHAHYVSEPLQPPPPAPSRGGVK
jgi:hypothetical protein